MNIQSLNYIFEMLENICYVNTEVYFLGDLSIDWFSSSCPLKRKLLTVTSVCNLVQVINQHNTVFTNTTGTRSSTCINHIFTNTVELCSEAVSIPIGCNDHNIVAISRKAKVPSAGSKIVYKRSYKRFCCDSYVDDVKNICWSDVINEEHPDVVPEEFMMVDKHAPVKKRTIRTVKAPWIDEDFKNCMVERDWAKGVANMTG